MKRVAFLCIAVVGCGDNLHLGQPKVAIAPADGLTTTEGGGQATFAVSLEGSPRNDVMVEMSSSNVREGTISPASLLFTIDDYAAPQIVTITGVQDEVADGAQPYAIVLAPAISMDSRFDGLDGDDVAVENVDDDTAGVRVTPVANLVTSETGGSAQFAVVLNSKPTADVSISLSSSDTTEGTVSPASLTFTVDNWNAPQNVTVTGVDDFLDDGAQTYTILTAVASSADPSYASVDSDDVTVSNTDNDTAGVTITPVTGLTTTEAGGQATFVVVLDAQPTADVTIPVASLDLSEGTPDVSSLTFTPTNWNAPQMVTVTGLDDFVADGNQVYTIVLDPATSADGGYSAFDAGDVSVTNTDNDSAGITLSKTAGLTTTESGGQDTFTIVLNSQPTAPVTIALTSSDAGEGTISPSSLTFTVANWNAPQVVRLTGIDDFVQDGNQPYTIATASAISVDPGYSGRDAADATASNIDNDSAGFIVQPTTGLATTEAGGQVTFTVVLTSQPTANVTVPVSSSDPGEGTPSTTGLTFTPANWNAPQTVTVTGVDDLIADGAQPYSIVIGAAASGDATYLGMNPSDVSLTNTDNDTAGITVSKTNVVTGEAGGQDTFTIVLNSQPTASVTIGLTSSDTSEGTVSPASVTFTTTNWNAPQTITVTGVNDFVADGNQIYSIITAPATSSDATYQGRNAADVSALNVDNDSPGIIVTVLANLETGENGDTATFTIALASQPTASVTINLSSSDLTEGTVSPASVTFTTVNWNAPQTITVTGVDDAVADGNQLYKIFTAPATSTDPKYDTLDADDVTLRNLDNDTPGIIVATTPLTTNESGTSAQFAVVLQSQPTADVAISVSPSDPSEGAVTPQTLTFTSVNWSSPQFVTVTGVDDAIADGNQVYSVITAAAVSADGAYNGLNGSDVSVTNVDNDSPGIRVTPTSGLSTTEGGGTTSFAIVLESQPQANVTLTLSSSDTTEGTITQTTLTFTPVNWSSPQSVTVTGVDDAIADGNQPYTIVIDKASSADLGYDVINPPDVALSNIDNDTAAVLVNPTSGLSTSEAGGTAFFTVVLTSQPTADVIIDLTSSDPTEGAPTQASITITPAEWNVPHTVTVAGIDDTITDGNQLYTIVTSTTSSADAAFNNLLVADVDVTNVDNDIAGFTLDPLGGLITQEFGDFDTFTIVLNAAPTADVTIPLSISDPTEATLGAVTSVTFTSANWNVPQTITVTGLDDLLADGDQPFFVVTGAAISADPNYNGLNPPDIDGTNYDNDTPGIYIKARRLLRTSEAGQNTFFKVSLTTQPTADVTCTFQSSDPTEGTISPTTLTFTPTNFAVLQTVTVSGVDDTINDDDQLYTIISLACTSADGSYNNINPRDISVLNRDND